jgi:fatty-acyl-CoA synthase
MVVQMNVNRFLYRANRVYGNKVGIHDEDMSLTYHEFYLRVQRLSHALQGSGVGPGDRVAWLGYNNHQLLEAYYGVVQYGAILVPLNIRLRPEDLAAILDDADPKLLVFDADFEPIVAKLARAHAAMRTVEIQMEGVHPGYQGYEEFIAGQPTDDAGDPDLDENSLAEIFYTSGTTGQPKGVTLTHRNLYMHALNTLASSPITDETVMLHTVPLFHVNGWGSPHYLTARGGTHVMLRRFVPEAVLGLVERHRVTDMSLVPVMVQALNSHPRVRDFDLSSLRRIIVGGAPSPSAFVRQTHETLHTEYSGGYGLSETSPTVSIALIKDTLLGDPEDRVNALRGTAGIPVIGVAVSIVDDDDNDLPWDGDKVGELRIRADTVTPGYWHQPEETARSVRAGWFYSGDMAAIDPEGYIHIVGRKKDIIVSGGENISGVELEDILYTHPAVLECCVIGTPDPTWGEKPHGIVVLKPGVGATPEELMRHVNDRVAGFKRLKALDIVADLPKTGTGKIQKAEVKRMFGAGWQK